MEKLGKAVLAQPPPNVLRALREREPAAFAGVVRGLIAPAVRLARSLTPEQIRDMVRGQPTEISALRPEQQAEILRMIAQYEGGRRAWFLATNLTAVDFQRSGIRFDAVGRLYFYSIPRGEKDPNYRGVAHVLGFIPLQGAG